MRPVLCQVLVGREEESGRLAAALAQARDGCGSMVLLAGESGIGKSRLTRTVAQAALGLGCTTLKGRAVAGGVPTPYRPFAEALASALRPGGIPADADLDPFWPALGRLVPQLPAARPGDGDDSLVFLGEAVLRLLRVLRPDGPFLLVLEDLHWADAETLALLEYLADNLRTERVLCVGTLRPDEGNDAYELAAKLATRGSADVLRLRQLDAAAVAIMAHECLGGGDLPASVLEYVLERAEGIPFLVEELLAGLVGDGTLIERDGHWHTTGPVSVTVPVTFADGVARRLGALESDSRRVISAAAVLGRRFEWSLLSSMTDVSEESVLAALREGVDLQLIAIRKNGFGFRHALTHEAVLGALLPPELAMLAGAALAAVESAHPGLPGDWCKQAADLAAHAGDTARARQLLIESGRRDLAVGALASAESTLTQARAMADSAGLDGAVEVDEALAEVYALSGQVDRAIEMGHRLLNRIGPAPVVSRSADLHLRIARAAIAGARWADAQASVEVARAAPHPEIARVDAVAAQIAEGRKRWVQAVALARTALEAADAAALPEVACEALEVIGRVARQHDLAESDRAFGRAASIAQANGLPVWRLRALYELGTNHMVQTDSVDQLLRTRSLSEAQGTLALTAALDVLIAVGLNKQQNADEGLDYARRAAQAALRFRLASLPMALMMQANAHAVRGERDDMEARIAEAIKLTPKDRDVLGGSWGYCRGQLSLQEEDLEQAWRDMSTGAKFLLSSPAQFAPPFLGMWPLIGAVLGHDVTAATEQVVAVHGKRRRLLVALMGYADAVLAGRRGDAAAAEAAFATADAQVGPLVVWYRHYARRLCAQAAIADGWGDPVSWLREASAYFEERGDERIAAACRRLIREAGAPVPRRRPGDAELPDRLRVSGITGREADVLELIARGLTNKEIAAQMFLSPRTVEKHVANLLIKTGLRRRVQLAGYFAEAYG